MKNLKKIASAMAVGTLMFGLVACQPKADEAQNAANNAANAANNAAAN